MKWETTPAFDGDLGRLSPTELQCFRDVVRQDFIPAARDHLIAPGAAWPGTLRVKAVRSAPNVYEMTWSFAGPDGRATWEWVRIGGEIGIRWRRVGGHAIFRRP